MKNLKSVTKDKILYMHLQPLVKKYKNVRYRRWDPSFTDTLPQEPGVPEKEIRNVSYHEHCGYQSCVNNFLNTSVKINIIFS